MKIKKGDKVIVLTGKDKGKTGEVVRALPALDKVVVEGVNLSKRHKKAKTGGGIFDMAMPIHVSNVKIAEKSEKKAPSKKETKAKAPKAKKEEKAAE